MRIFRRGSQFKYLGETIHAPGLEKVANEIRCKKWQLPLD